MDKFSLVEILSKILLTNFGKINLIILSIKKISEKFVNNSTLAWNLSVGKLSANYYFLNWPFNFIKSYIK